MKRRFKTRIYPNKSQQHIILRTMGACRWVWNLYLEYNHKRYNETGKFLSGYEFGKILTKLKKKDEYKWLNEISSKAMTDSVMSADKAFREFFKGKRGHPKFKSRKRPVNSFFIVKDSIHLYKDNEDMKHLISLPILGKVRISESKDHFPDNSLITSGRISMKNGKYYVSFIYDKEVKEKKVRTYGLGIDIGIKNYLTIYASNGKSFSIESFLNDKNYKKIDEKIQFLQQIISKKVEVNYGRSLNRYFDKHHEEPSEKTKNIMKRESYNTSNIRRLQTKVSKLYEKRRNYTKNVIDTIVCRMVRTKPKYITIEDLDVSSMLENDKSHTLHDHIQKSNFYYFRLQLISKCEEENVELRIAKKYFASSKKCSCCGHKKKYLSLSDRVYVCEECGLEIDRDLNAAINLCETKKFKIA